LIKGVRLVCKPFYKGVIHLKRVMGVLSTGLL